MVDLDRRTTMQGGAAFGAAALLPSDAEAFLPFLLRMIVGAGARRAATRALIKPRLRPVPRKIPRRSPLSSQPRPAPTIPNRPLRQKGAGWEMLSRTADVATLGMLAADVLGAANAYASDFPNGPNLELWYPGGNNFFGFRGENLPRKRFVTKANFHCIDYESRRRVALLRSNTLDYNPSKPPYGDYKIGWDNPTLPTGLTRGSIILIQPEIERSDLITVEAGFQPILIGG